MAKKVTINGFDENEVMKMVGAGGVPPSATPPNAASSGAAAAVQSAAAAQSVPAASVEKNGQLAPTEQSVAEQPVPMKRDEQPVPDEAPETGPPAPTAEAEKSTPAKRKKQRTYDEVFLTVYNIGSLRKPIPVSPETHERLDTIVRIALNGRISLSNFVENILCCHMEEYKDELKSRLNDNIKQNFLGDDR
jgi:hypothetical protein